jgi:hypothetical protein
MIWCHRNVIIFDGASTSLGRWKEAFKDEFALIIHRAKPMTKILLTNWLSNALFFFSLAYGFFVHL